jgi:hypothetical protein
MFLDKERSVGMLDIILFSYPDSLFYLHVSHFVVADGQGKRGHMQIGSWDAIHVIQVAQDKTFHEVVNCSSLLLFLFHLVT